MIEAVDPGRTDVLRSERVAGGMLPRVRGTLGMVVIVGALVVSALVAQQRLRVVQNAVNAVCVLYGAVILLVLVAGVVYLVTGHPAATDPAALSTWSPSHQHGINFANWTFFGVVVLALLGVEVPLNMGVEIRDRKAVTRYLLCGSAVVILAYLVTTWAVMVTVPAGGNQSVQITAVADVVGRILGPSWGQLAAAVLAGVTAFVLYLVGRRTAARTVEVDDGQAAG